MKTLLILLLLVVPGTALLAVEIKVPLETGFYRLRSLTFEEAKEAAQPFLSPDGKLGYASSRNVLIIHDRPGQIETVKQILQELDTAPANIRVEVTFDASSTGEATSVGVERVGVQAVRRDGRTAVDGDFVLGVGAGSTNSSEFTSQFVLAGNNRPAQIWVGRSVADPVWVFEYGAAHGWWRRDWVWRDFGVSLWALPHILPDGQIEIEVFPRISARGDSATVVTVKELSTRVVVASGEPVALGGLDQERRTVYRRLLGIANVFDGSRLAITLRATIIPVNPRPATSIPPPTPGAGKKPSAPKPGP